MGSFGLRFCVLPCLDRLFMRADRVIDPCESTRHRLGGGEWRADDSSGCAPGAGGLGVCVCVRVCVCVCACVCDKTRAYPTADTFNPFTSFTVAVG